MNKMKTYYSKIIGSGVLGGILLLDWGGGGLQPEPIREITINGVAVCKTQFLINFKNLRVDVYSGSLIKTSAKLDSYGRFTKLYSERAGKHLVILFDEAESKIIDQHEFHSSRYTKVLNINLNACPDK